MLIGLRMNYEKSNESYLGHYGFGGNISGMWKG